jgi:hypothetical protein
MKFEAVNERICSLKMKEKSNNFPILIHTLEPEENELVKDPFYDTLNHIYQRIPAHDTKIIVGNCNAKIGREAVFKPVTGNWGLHEILN